MPLPTIAIAGHRQLKGVTNLVLDELHGAQLALKHLVDLGHSEIAVLEGPAYSSDSTDRWRAVRDVFRDLGLRFQPELQVQLEGDCTVSEAGYAAAKKLLQRRRPFTALLAFNDSSAIGAISAINELGLRVPDDISVVGFDDVPAAAFSIPSLTTVSQPLIEMGEIAASTLLDQIKNQNPDCAEIRVKPNFVVRKSTARPKTH
jgi:LacI family transcriptional regulator